MIAEAWLLTLSLAGEPSTATVLHTSEAECRRIGHEIADKFERGFEDKRIVVECVPMTRHPHQQQQF